MTTIKEEEYEKPIIITPHKFSCDDEDLTIPAPLVTFTHNNGR
jgi:hypothetical protein